MFNIFKKSTKEQVDPVLQRMKKLMNAQVYGGDYIVDCPLETFRYNEHEKCLEYFFDDKWWRLSICWGTMATRTRCCGTSYTYYCSSPSKPDICLVSGKNLVRFHVSPYADNKVMIDTENVNYVAYKIKELLDKLCLDMETLERHQKDIRDIEDAECRRRRAETDRKDSVARNLGSDVSALYYLNK